MLATFASSKLSVNRFYMKRIGLSLIIFSLSLSHAGAQTQLSLDSCRAMAVRNNKQLQVSRVKQDVAGNLKRSARTKYLPHVSAIGTYEHTSKPISLLSTDQQADFASLGTSSVGALQGSLGSGMETQLGNIATMLVRAGVPAQQVQQMAGDFQQFMGQAMTGTAGVMNALGEKIVDAFHTDTRNVWAGSIMATQPLFMGGSIIAMNRLADLGEEMASNSADARLQTVVYNTDQAYWQVVSLRHKKNLAESYLQLITKLDDDVQKMIQEGVATRSDGLSVSVKVNEAQMAVQKVDDGLTLARMLLCKIIGLPLNEEIVLADESITSDPNSLTPDPSPEEMGVYTTSTESSMAKSNYSPLLGRGVGGEAVGAVGGGTLRPELRMLSNVVDMSRQTTNILKAGNLPQVALTGGYAVSNPNVFNGFQKKFSGFWNVGLLVRIPLWNWGDVAYKVRASKGATAIANLELEEARDLIDLQVSQAGFKVTEADKRLALAQTSIERAEENLRTANLGFREGVVTPTVVMEAQTAWLQAQSQQIDAMIDARLAQVDYRKALGILAP